MKPDLTENTRGKRLSALVCVHNEEPILRACLEKLRFADEVVVLLDKCTDGSAAIAKELADKVVEGAFPLEGTRRRAGLAACTGDYVIEVDADEHVTPALAEELRARVGDPTTADWYLVPIDNYIGSHLVRYGWGGSFGTSASARFYKRTTKNWGDEPVHPSVQFTGRSGGRLKNPMSHFVDKNISEMIQRLDRYTTEQAKFLRFKPSARHGLASHAFRGLRRFWKCYVSRKGYREGDWGVLVALMAAYYPILSELKARLDDFEPLL